MTRKLRGEAIGDSEISSELLDSSISFFPAGGIIMWSGAISSIPSGWQLCNGTNGTPDLRNKFIVGAWSDNANVAYPNVPPGGTGGSANAVLIAHDHTISPDKVLSSANGGPTTLQGSSSGTPLNYNTSTDSATVGINSSGNASTTQTGTNANLPPYYALAYIMKLSP